MYIPLVLSLPNRNYQYSSHTNLAVFIEILSQCLRLSRDDNRTVKGEIDENSLFWIMFILFYPLYIYGRPPHPFFTFQDLSSTSSVSSLSSTR